MSDQIGVSELKREELNQFEEMLFDQILDLRYIENNLSEIEIELDTIQRCATNVFEEVPASFPDSNVEVALDDVAEKIEQLEKKHDMVEEELQKR